MESMTIVAEGVLAVEDPVAEALADLVVEGVPAVVAQAAVVAQVAEAVQVVADVEEDENIRFYFGI